MTMDEFVDATIDVWDIPTESATRVGHPAPFPVELPRRLIELYTYRGDLVLDPFMGSGSTAVAAVRTERHYVGFDTDPDLRGPGRASGGGASGRRLRTRPGAPPAGHRPSGRSAPRRSAADGRGARRRPGPEGPRAGLRGPGRGGFGGIERNVAYGDLGLSVDFRARDAGRRGLALRSLRAPTRPPVPGSGGPRSCGGCWGRPASSTRPGGGTTTPGRRRAADPPVHRRPRRPVGRGQGPACRPGRGRRRSDPRRPRAPRHGVDGPAAVLSDAVAKAPMNPGPECRPPHAR